MNIQEAVREALKTGGVICRESIRREHDTRFAAIMPTNSYEACKLMIYQDNTAVKGCRCWNPTADDLIADDWSVFKV